jgi:ribonuclease P protein subunit POP4
MIRSPKNLVRHELIGLKAKVVRARNASLVGIEGVVVDETKHMIMLDDGKRERKIPKSEVKLHFTLPNAVVEVDGKILIGKPEDRIKKVYHPKI